MEMTPLRRLMIINKMALKAMKILLMKVKKRTKAAIVKSKVIAIRIKTLNQMLRFRKNRLIIKLFKTIKMLRINQTK